MSRKSFNADDLDLSLSGSQLLSPASAGRRPASAKGGGKRPSSTSGGREKTGLNVVNGLSNQVSGAASSHQVRQRSNSHGTPRSQGTARSQTSARSHGTVQSQGSARSQGTPRQMSARSQGRVSESHGKPMAIDTFTPVTSARDDFLALFESSTQPKILQPGPTRSQPTHKKGGAGGPRPAWASQLNSARSATTDHEIDHRTQASGGGHSRYTHSVFQPTSARSSSTLDEEDLTNHNMDHRSNRPQPREELQLNLSHRSPSHEDINFNFDHKPFEAKPLGFESKPMTQDEINRSRNSLYGENSQQGAADTSVQKSHKLNSIANNMTSQAMSPGTKMALLDMENSYQNIKPKTPVNQVRQSPLNPTGTGKKVSEDYARSCAMAATKIQRWYRRHQTRRKAGQAAMKRLMETKRAEKAEEMSQERDYVSAASAGQGAEQRKRLREEKARQARQEAIQELQRKRDEKRQEGQRCSDGEMKYLQPSGKVTKVPSHKSTNVKKAKAPAAQADGHSDSDNEQQSGAVEGAARPGTAPTSGRRIEEIFQNNSPRPSLHNSQGGQVSSPRAEMVQDGEEEEDDDHTISALQTERTGRTTSRGRDHSVDDAGAAASQSGTKTTLDDLMETLKKLEEEEKLPSGSHNKNKTPRNWLDDLEKDVSEGEKPDLTLLTADKLQTLNPSKDNIKKSGFLTDEKLRSIISFLDEVETADRLDEIDQEGAKKDGGSGSEIVTNEFLTLPALQVPSGEQIAEMEQASAMASEVTNTMLAQRLELDERKRSVSMLQKALNQQRELTVRHARETEKEMKKRLDVQKEEYEETVKRHLGFIDQLIDDKKVLSEKCENLVKELKTIDKKCQTKLKEQQERFDIEMKKVKDVQAAAEKLRRERWIDEKTKKIKEMTVKGLEPEIQRLIAKHKSEIKKLKSIHEAELLASDERAGQRYISMTEELRDQLAKEKESACARERELARQTYEKQLQQEEEAYQQQRRRLYAEVQDEKERLAASSARQRAELDKLQRQLEDNHSHTAEAMKREFEKAREEQERRHSTELQQLKEQLAIEKAAWEENYKKKQETWLLSKERDLKENVRKDRDMEIEEVISRLEEDNRAARDECERVAENRIKRMRDKYETEIAELERSERLTSQKYNEIKAKLAEMEGENERRKVTLKQKDREVAEIKRLLDKLNEERDRVSEVIRQEFADRLALTDEENRRVKNQMAELKAQHKIELQGAKTKVEEVTQTKEQEMEEVHKRVKQAMVRKEEVVNQLKGQYQAALKRADHLEGLLEQQRKQLLKR